MLQVPIASNGTSSRAPHRVPPAGARSWLWLAGPQLRPPAQFAGARSTSPPLGTSGPTLRHQLPAAVLGGAARPGAPPGGAVLGGDGAWLGGRAPCSWRLQAGARPGGADLPPPAPAGWAQSPRVPLYLLCFVEGQWAGRARHRDLTIAPPGRVGWVPRGCCLLAQLTRLPIEVPPAAPGPAAPPGPTAGALGSAGGRTGGDVAVQLLCAAPGPFQGGPGAGGSCSACVQLTHRSGKAQCSLLAWPGRLQGTCGRVVCGPGH